MDPMTLLAAGGGLASLFGGMGASRAQARLLRAQRGLYDQMGQTYATYMPQVTSGLSALARNPSTASYRAGLASAEADSMRDMQGGMDAYTAAMRRRGMGTNSSLLASGLASLARGRTDSLAGARVGSLNDLEARKLAALQALGGYASGMGGMAAGGYGQQAAGYGQQAADAYGGLGQLAQLYMLGQGGMRPSAPTGAQVRPYEDTRWLGGMGAMRTVLPSYDDAALLGGLGRAPRQYDESIWATGLRPRRG